MKRLVLLLALAALIASAVFVVHALDDNDYWQPCTIGSTGVITCELIERRGRRWSEIVIEAKCLPAVIVPGVGLKHVCTLKPEYLSHLIGREGTRR